MVGLRLFFPQFSIDSHLLGENKVNRNPHIDIGRSVLTMWERYGEIIREARVRSNQPMLLEWFEFLVNEMNKICTNRGFTEPQIYAWKKATPDE